ncbi:MAG: hypothetical protein QM820_60470 [Minicystis sp.]
MSVPRPSNPTMTVAERTEPYGRDVERNAALLAYFASPPPEMRALDTAWEEALALYGDEDSDAWVAALADGTHPLCRVRAPAPST